MTPERAFPLRVAGVDCGSNAIRFLAAEFSAPGKGTIVHQERVPVRLGHEVFLSGTLNTDAIAAAVAAFRGFAQQLERLAVDGYRAVATSAVREARNRDVLLDAVRAEAGLELEVITGTEEARLVHRAVTHRLDLSGGKWVLVDLGGGSVEVSLVDDAGMLWTESHTIGTVRLLEVLQDSAHEPVRFRRLVDEYLNALRVPAPAQYWEPAGLIATGGNIEALAELAGAPRDEKGAATLKLADLEAAIERLSALGYEERIERLGLRPDRADVILPAAMVYHRVAALVGAGEIVVPHIGVKEGLLLDAVDRLVSDVLYRAEHARVVRQGAVSLGRRYMFDEAHGLHVADLALHLFDALQDLHRLGAHERTILMAAAILHEIGSFIAHKKHHKHSHYIISRSELPALSWYDMQLVALVARYHRGADPSERHRDFAALDPDHRRVVRRLSAHLRLADALDRQQRQLVESVSVRIDEDMVTLTPRGRGELLLERWALARKKRLFEEEFDRTVVVS